jgi:propionate CoA-transferase
MTGVAGAEPMSKILDAEAVARQIPDGATVAIPGNASIMVVDHLLAALERRFVATASPKNLTVYTPCNAGLGPGTGVDRFAHKGLLKRYIASAFPVYAGSSLADMIAAGEVECYNFPMGVLYGLLRETAAGRPGLVTHVGLDTYVDPQFGGGKMNAATTEDLVERVILSGRDLLFYPTIPIDVVLIKATTADTNGNLTLEHEPLSLGILALAMAAKCSGGKVFVQVERIAARGTLSARQIVVPEHLVDGIVLAPDAPQSALSANPSITGEVKVEVSREPIGPGPERIVLSRAAAELRAGWLINLGVGIANGVPRLLYEAGLESLVTISTEHGGINGLPNPLPVFGAHTNVGAVMDPTNVFDMYSGGLLDATFLGMAEVDAEGNVNVSRFNGRLMGCGGFIDITARTRNIIFCGTFTSGGFKAAVRDGRLVIEQEGRVRKFVQRVSHRTFSGKAALARNQNVLLVTERGLFRLTSTGWLLVEVAPGIDPATQIAPLMDFPLACAPELVAYRPEVLAPAGSTSRDWLRRQLAGGG